MRHSRFRRSPIPPCAFALLCCVTAGGCDSRQLVAPSTPSIAPAVRDASDEGALIGAATVAAEQTAGVSLGSVTELTYALVQVGGQFDGRPNPACAEQPPSWPCIFNAPASDFYDLAPYTTGPVQAWVVAGGSLSSIPLRGTGGAVNTPGQAIGLYYGEASAEIRVRAALNNFASQNPNPGGSVTSWILSGAYSVTAREINPLTFTGGPTGDADGTLSFTVAPTAPLKFLNPDGVSPAAPPGDPSWYFVPGESVPLKYGPGTAYPIDACFRQTTCTYTPPADLNGRMQVVAYVENRIVIGRSAEVRSTGCHGNGCEQEPKLVLTCDGHADSVSLERAKTLGCVASAPVGGQLRVTGWTFEGGGQTITRDPASAQQTQWRGIMVVSGKISVAGTVNGTPSSASVLVTVTERRWTEATPPVLGPHKQGCVVPDRATYCLLRYPPDRVGEFGVTQPFGGTVNLPSRAAHVDDGPNGGFSYVGGSTSPIVIDSLVIYLNQALFDPQDELWRRQSICSREPLLEWANRHEHRHAELVLEAIARGLANGVSLEAMVRFVPLPQMREYLRTTGEQEFRQFLADAGDAGHVVQVWEFPPCRISSMFTSR